MNCPRCKCHIADGFYCIRCGYVPTIIDLAEASKLETQILRGILKAASREHVIETPARLEA